MNLYEQVLADAQARRQVAAADRVAEMLDRIRRNPFKAQTLERARQLRQQEAS